MGSWSGPSPAAPHPADLSGTATVLRAGLLRASGNHASPDGPGVRIRYACLEAVITPLSWGRP
ncbi:hypothetical protein ABTZ98_25960 [Streptomyces bacillaris]